MTLLIPSYLSHEIVTVASCPAFFPVILIWSFIVYPDEEGEGVISTMLGSEDFHFKYFSSPVVAFVPASVALKV